MYENETNIEKGYNVRNDDITEMPCLSSDPVGVSGAGSAIAAIE